MPKAQHSRAQMSLWLRLSCHIGKARAILSDFSHGHFDRAPPLFVHSSAGQIPRPAQLPLPCYSRPIPRVLEAIFDK